MIESVTPQQLQSLAKRMMESKPSVGAFGDLRSVPNYEVSLNLLSVLLEISGVFLIMR